MAQILIADDDEALRDLVQRVLQSDGHTVDVVADGGEALSRLESGALPDVLVADIDMPVIDGISLAQKALAKKSDLRVLMISGMVERLDAARALQASRVATLQKPFTLEAVRAEVASLLA